MKTLIESNLASLGTSGGVLSFPAFLPVTTFGGKFPLDTLLRPYLAQMCPAVMVSHHYAQKMKDTPAAITFVDSGGFASLFRGAHWQDLGDRYGIRTPDGHLLDPLDVLNFQCGHAQIGATVDFIIPPDASEEEADLRQSMTSRNALWSIRHLAGDLRLFASIQAWDADSAAKLTEELADQPFAGFALGGMVPRLKKPETIFDIVSGIRRVDARRPLHVFGIGTPTLVKELFDRGVDSVDSSSFVRSAVSKRYLHPSSGRYVDLGEIVAPQDVCPCRICQSFNSDYLALEGELNNMALALHNLAATTAYALPGAPA
jgi:tRNA-guanine family transglycosylase